MPMTFADSHSPAARRFIAYVMGDMAGLWATKGWDKAAGHGVERLEADLTPSALGFRRSMAVGRQLFFFSHAWRVTGDSLYGARAHALYADLTTRFWDGQHGGWFFSLADDGTPADATKDLYGQAFVMFGLAHYASIFRKPEALDWAWRTNELVNRLWLPSGWYAQSASRDWIPLDTALEQNPHMHLLEAYLSLHAASGDASFLSAAERLVAIHTARLSKGGKVLEHFDIHGMPQADKGRLVQPGHSYEWFWLLNEYADVTGLPAHAEAAEALIAWADANGVDADHGGIYSYLDIDGAVVDDRKRIWPVTECIKAHAVSARRNGTPAAYAAVAKWIGFLSATYFTGAGGWHEYVRRDLQPDSDFMPSSTPYHIAMAALEVERLLGGPGAKLNPVR